MGDTRAGKPASLPLKHSSALTVVSGDERDKNRPGSAEKGQAATPCPEAAGVSPTRLSLHCCFSCVCTASTGGMLLSNAKAVSLIP